MRQLNQTGLDLIETFEGCVLHPYKDIVGIPTIGIGTTMYPDGKKVTLQDPPISKERAYELLRAYLNKDCASIEKMVTVPINDNQFGALVSFAYNCGIKALANSTLLKRLNAGEYQKAADEFLRWNRAGGVVVKGLTRRREAERALFLLPV
jgi:lysozyme